MVAVGTGWDGDDTETCSGDRGEDVSCAEDQDGYKYLSPCSSLMKASILQIYHYNYRQLHYKNQT